MSCSGAPVDRVMPMQMLKPARSVSKTRVQAPIDEDLLTFAER